MLTALIFDYDGVIVESHSFNRHGISNAAERLGLPFDDQMFQQFFATKPLEVGASMYLTYVHRPELKNELLALKQMYDSEYVYEMDIIQSTLFFMDRVKNFYKMAIVADAPRHDIEEAMRKVKRHYLFDAFIGNEDFENGLPEPDAFVAATSNLQVSAPEALAIVSAPASIYAAGEAGMRTLAVTHAYPEEALEGAELIVPTLADVTDEVLEKFNT